jgi:hypothetical protein
MIQASSTVTIHGIDGILFALAVIAFLVAAIVAWFVAPRAHWATAISVGLLLWVLTNLVK